MFAIPRPPLSRRTFLRGMGIGLALPCLDAMLPRQSRAAEAAPPMRLVCICASLGLHAPSFMPTAPGRDYELSPYLQTIKDFRNRFTVFSGLSHPDQSGADGHSSEFTWLTSAKHPGLGGFRNTISLDQWAAEKIGFQTRYASLALGTGGTSQSYTRSGVMIPAETKPSRVFARLFLDGKPEEVAARMRDIHDGRSILDAVAGEARRLEQRVSGGDREKLQEYFQSIREMEQRLAAAEDWAKRPKPKVEAQPPQDIADEKDLIARMKLLFELVPLALQTDSTRLVTILVQGRNDIPPVAGVSIDHHNLSHHGQDSEKLRQLQLIEGAEMSAFSGLLQGLSDKKESSGALLDRTMVLLGSNLGNANSHDTRNLPILLAGGRFRHGQHLALDAKNNTPLSNLFVALLQGLGLGAESFGSSTQAGIKGLDALPAG